MSAGTSLAATQRDAVASPPDEIVIEFRRSFRKGTVFTTVLTGVVLALLAAAGFPAWRLGVIAVTLVIVTALHLVLLSRTTRSDQVAYTALYFCLLSAPAHFSAYAMTGGLLSPLLPMQAAALAGPLPALALPRQRPIVFGTVVATVAALGLLPHRWAGDPPAAPYAQVLVVLAFAWAVFVVRTMAASMDDARSRAVRSMDDLRAERLNEALALARRLQSVGAKVAHELKNPLAAIKGLVQLVERSASDDPSRERLGVVRSEVDRMEVILRDYLSFARPLEDLVPAPVDLGALGRDVAAVLAARAEAGGVSLVVQGEPVVVRADRRRLKEAFLNLLSNALEATPAGGSVRLEVAPDGDGATVVVRDTGRGIPPDHLDRLGQSYFTTREGGTGLGFVLARSAVTQHGGRLEVDSKVGVGTTITVRLPAAPPEKRDG